MDALDELAHALTRPDDWHRDALCREYEEHADWWFPERGESTDAAKSVCRRCLVRAECLASALATPVNRDAGVWGATSRRERLRMRRQGVTADDIIAAENAPYVRAQQMRDDLAGMDRLAFGDAA